MKTREAVGHAAARRQLLSLSHLLGREDRGLAILGEGNTSAKLSEATFVVKASGRNLAGLSQGGLCECRFKDLLGLMSAGKITDERVDQVLLGSRVRASEGKPSVEAVFHAYLLTLPGVRFVGHTHPVAVTGLLCSSAAHDFAHRRLFPDAVVCCGCDSVLVPYADPGVMLARAIWRHTAQFIERRGEIPRVILLKNHGLITLGMTPQAVVTASMMAEKAARILHHASTGGRKPRFLSDQQVTRIGARPDEHHRQRVLGLSDSRADSRP
ncbi:MAG TPA: class II aldolase/adducin family protein [Opitutaceae bacterium]|jgi:rhamnose utilization protein RhaD (predicted bifunctional aldolase and dehydrogenase)|nr:class II aldolase/adducin family protein [Opitutaceae bacterium]